MGKQTRLLEQPLKDMVRFRSPLEDSVQFA